jgi:hypothetical protein
MEMRRVTVALCFAGLAGAGAALAAENPQDNKSTSQPHGIFRGALKAVKFDISPPLRSIPPVPYVRDEGHEDNDRPSGLEGPLGPQDVDRSVQTRVGPGEIPGPSVNFDGFSNVAGFTPPDPVGDIGPNHYFAAANVHFAIYSRTGTLLFGPVPNNTLWAGFGGPCQTNNSGDPIVLYDQLADRWLFGQLTLVGTLCMAVSTSPDPMATYFRYAFPSFGSTPDYPKWSIWPDAYYFSSRDFNASFIGIGAYAVDRAAVLAGNPAATLISFLATPGGSGGMFNLGDGLLPADLDGTILPPAGSPNYFVGSMDNGGGYGAPQDALTLWKFHADFVTPANSTFTLTNTLPVSAFDSIFPCAPSARECIPQPTTTTKIDHLGYRQRPTYRLAYRNFGTYESLVTNQSVEAPANIAGIRWYEIRSPNSSPVIFQEGTYSPGATDGIHRWMGSIAQDRAGNMALGYSVSDATATFPGVRYTGRLVTDPLGQMPQGEGTIVNGLGSQLSGGFRWGDYTSINMDPLNDCAFWYINEYYPVTSTSGWRLRIGSFRFPAPQCIDVPVELQSFAVE